MLRSLLRTWWRRRQAQVLGLTLNQFNSKSPEFKEALKIDMRIKKMEIATRAASSLSSPGCLKRAPNRSKIDFICYFEVNCGCLETGGLEGLTTTHRLMVNRSWCRWNDRIGPQCAPKCPSFEAGSF